MGTALRVDGTVESVWSGQEELLYSVVWGHHDDDTARRLAWVAARQEWGSAEAAEYDWAAAEVTRTHGGWETPQEGPFDLLWTEGDGLAPCTKVRPPS